ncbi:hypothetical protein A0H81_03152 [Grifola frondosa]|uniref:Uncharacterized protein n=1 Tax=Grifola frondosa TaxID=5627 RepID=A0A1C7MIQ8_GRIFR|nr:hypothetical protein A0H81_03152 [Grifola frondosa]
MICFRDSIIGTLAPDVNVNLAPFHIDDSDFWTPATARDITTFDYAELTDAGCVSLNELQKRVKQAINKLYDHNSTGSSFGTSPVNQSEPSTNIEGHNSPSPSPPLNFFSSVGQLPRLERTGIGRKADRICLLVL